MNHLIKTKTVLEKGGIIIFPTETVTGIGCRLGSVEAIERLYQIKKREKDKPTSIVVADLIQAKKYALFNQAAETLAQKFWPGSLSLVLPATEMVPKEIQGEGGSISLRVPGNSTLRQILEVLGEPILAPSANFAGESAPTKLASVDRRLIQMVDYVVNENAGGEKPSTVVDMTKNKPTLLREGGISLSAIQNALEEKILG